MKYETKMDSGYDEDLVGSLETGVPIPRRYRSKCVVCVKAFPPQIKTKI